MSDLGTIDWVQFISGVLGIMAAIFAGFRWMVKHYLMELRPNSGSTLKDAVNRIEHEVIALKGDVSDVHARVTNHMQWHMDQ